MSSREDFHPSHDMYLDHHRGCALCDPDDLDETLLESCAGFPWHEGITVKAGPDVTIRARKSGTGWV